MSNLIQWLIQGWNNHISSKLEPLLSVVFVSGLGVTVLALWSFVELADDVLGQETQAIDTAILQALRANHTLLLDQIALGVTFLGEPLVLVILSAAFGAMLLWQQQWVSAAALTITTGGGVGLNYLLKDFFARQRPALWERIVDVKQYSFPSGHAMISLVVYGFVGYWVATRYRRWRSLTITTIVCLIAAIGLSRLYLGVHWPTDIAAGYAAGTVWLLTCILSLEVATKLYTTAPGDLEELT
ncbi:MAG: phosphatase PAP2 family protein [Cyanophyceae cyanobacterium]